MLLIPSGSETTVEGISDHNPIVLQDVKSIDFERMLWMFYNEFSSCLTFCSMLINLYASRSYTDYTASAEKWSSIISLAHKWQFERMGHAAFKAYVALSGVQAVDKIAMGQRYDFPRTYLLEVYVEICTRKAPLSVEEGGKIGYETLALIAHSREEMKIWTTSSPELQKQVVTNNLINRLKSLYL